MEGSQEEAERKVKLIEGNRRMNDEINNKGEKMDCGGEERKTELGG